MYILSLFGRRSFIVFMLGLVILGTHLTVIQVLASRRLGIQSAGKINYHPGRIGSNVWKADLETGNLSQFSGIEVDAGNLLEVTSSVKCNGSYSMHVYKEEEISRVMGTYDVSPVMYDFHFKYAFLIENFTTSGWVRLVELRPKEGGTKIIYMSLFPSGKGQIFFIGGKTSEFNVVDGQWHVIDIFASSGRNGMIFIFLDGQPLTEVSGGLDLTDHKGDPYYLGLIWIGHIYSNNGVGHGDIYYDDIRLDEWFPPERPPQPPIGEFIYYPTVPKLNETVYFFGHYSSDIDGNLTSYEWTFPDGSTVQEVNASYSFDSEGEYQVGLTVTDDSGMNTTINRTILVYERQPAPVVAGWKLPLRTNGTKILDSLGNDVTLNLTGVAKMGINYGNPVHKKFRENDPTYYERDAQLMASWGIKLQRLPFNWYWYMTDHEYREIIKQIVDNYTSNGMLVLMDVHNYNFEGWNSWPAPYNSGGGLTKQEAWKIGRDAILSLKAVAHDFRYNPMVIGVEINEYRAKFPYEDPHYNYVFDFELTAELADEVHSVNPNLLVGIEIGVTGAGTTINEYANVRGYTRQLIQQRSNIVYMPHSYFSGTFGRSSIWQMYEKGDFEGGKVEMYNILDNYYLSEQNYYNLPVIVTEWGSNGYKGEYVVADEFDYLIAHNWGSTYWTWFRCNSDVGSDYNQNMGLLYNDWETPSQEGQVLIQKLTEIG